MKKCIIILYFGEFPNTIDAFLRSCKSNKNFDWLLFADNKLENIPNNVSVIYSSLEEIKLMIEEKLEMEISLSAPYKLCDYRPAFGLIFEKYIKDYDFWGYGDIDLVYGNLSNFIREEVLIKYDKIYPCGHLSLIRNTDVFNNAFKKEVNNTLNYKEVFTNDKSFIFDEYMGINEKIMFLGGNIYDEIDFVDMDIIYERFRVTDRRTINQVFPKYLFNNKLPKNYKKQIFTVEGNRAFRIYVDKNIIKRSEVAYIHYRHKIKSLINIDKNKNFYITNSGFIKKEEEITPEIIRSLNPYKGFIFELREYLRFYKNQQIYKLGKNMKIRNFIRVVRGKRKLNE